MSKRKKNIYGEKIIDPDTGAIGLSELFRITKATTYQELKAAIVDGSLSVDSYSGYDADTDLLRLCSFVVKLPYSGKFFVRVYFTLCDTVERIELTSGRYLFNMHGLKIYHDAWLDFQLGPSNDEVRKYLWGTVKSMYTDYGDYREPAQVEISITFSDRDL